MAGALVKLTCFQVLGVTLSLALVGPLTPAAAQLNSSPEARVVLQQIEADILAQRWEQARRRLESNAQQLVGEPDFHFLRAAVGFHDHAHGQALQHLSRAITLAPRQARYHLLRGQIYQKLGDRAAAKRDFVEGIELNWSSPGGVLLLVNAHIEEQHLEDAVAVLEQALQRMPTSAPVHLELGRVREMLGRPKEGVESYARAAALDPTLSLAQAGLGRLYRDFTHELSRAAEHLQKAVELEPENHAWRYHLGLTYQRQQNWEAAQVQFEKAAELNPTDPGVYSALAEVYRQRDLPEKAAEARRRFAELASTAEQEKLRLARLEFDFKQAQELESSGRTEEAVALYQRIQAASPNEPQVYFALARLYLNADQATRAEEQIRHALEAQPDNADYHRLYALILLALGRPPEAEQALQTATLLKPSDGETYNLLGNLLLQGAQSEAAIAAYRRAVELAPAEPAYRLNLWAAYRRQGDEAAARREWEAYEKILAERRARQD